MHSHWTNEVSQTYLPAVRIFAAFDKELTYDYEQAKCVVQRVTVESDGIQLRRSPDGVRLVILSFLTLSTQVCD